jgi:hypothetical protein
MRNKALATGLATALIMTGCGEQAHDTATHPDPIKTDVADIIHDPGYKRLGFEFSGVDPAALQHLASFSLAATGQVHRVEAYTEGTPSDQDEQTVKLYGAIQEGLLGFADRYPSIRLPLFKADGALAEAIDARLTISTHPSIVVITEPKAFSTPFEAQDPTLPAAGTIAPINGDNTEKLKDPVTFFDTKISVQYNSNAIGTEACQALINIEVDEKSILSSAQEAVCNSLGFAFGMAYTGYSYIEYTKAINTDPPLITTPDGQYYMSFFVIPEPAYQQLQARKTPHDLQGIHSVG